MSELTGSNHRYSAQFKSVQTVIGQRFAGNRPTVCPTTTTSTTTTTTTTTLFKPLDMICVMFKVWVLIKTKYICKLKLNTLKNVCIEIVNT